MSFVGVDVGGTFTDLSLFDPESGRVHVVKTLTTPADLSDGVMAGLAALPIGNMSGVRLLQHATTLVTNSLIERKGARVGLLTTIGFRDVLEIMRTDRERLYDLQWRRPQPLVPRRLRREVTERIGPFGEILIPLDEQSVIEAATTLTAEGCDSIAISLLHSHVNDEHERRVKEIVLERYQDVSVYLSSEIDPQYREYERTSTTVLTAFVGPVVNKYLSTLGGRLEGEGFDLTRLGIMQSNGGTLKIDRACARAGAMFLSGPAAGMIGAIESAKLSGFDRIITMDMGGTSCDVGLAVGGTVQLQTHREVEFQIPLRVPSLDVVTIGAGGGSVARVDAGGGLHVGPGSAGASPGPACYGRGGDKPTVTDANVALGRIHDGPIADGSVTVSGTAARDAIQRYVSKPLGLSIADAALGVVEIATTKMANAIREISVSRGHDPRDFVLVAFGGAGPLHAGYVARELGIPRTLVPRSSGVLSAVGCMLSDVRIDYMRSVMETLTPVTLRSISAVVHALQSECDAALEVDGFTPDDRSFLVAGDMRYAGQVHEVPVALPENLAEWSVPEITARFDAAHSALYGRPFPGHEIEVVNVRVSGIGHTPKPQEPKGDPRAEPTEPQPTETRTMTLKEGTFDCPVYARNSLACGSIVAGPAIIESFDCTILVLPASVARVDAHMSLIIDDARA